MPQLLQAATTQKTVREIGSQSYVVTKCLRIIEKEFVREFEYFLSQKQFAQAQPAT